ncbi:two-component sensor histidine kinase [Oceanidesulfovibrio indonesiensis]|uniref:histidine kinase n=1 Tax=Oceanidesulfovibrio indonesiensis TaxID=54767 RepID=A0A7M3MCE3_9BACT|nr:HAMP domain-containing sensor histidine kinase [Oceanidesulfovibrio indonesiensis]TVM16022.1 two-component sensor histidine kinase [Oceanidesulfovibrio indonesiensis]
MIQSNLLRSSTFRLGLLYMALFGFSVLLLLGFIYWTTAGFMERQTMATINAEIQGLRERYELLGLAGLIQVINERVSTSPSGDSLYLLTNSRFNPLAGNLDKWPEARSVDEGWLHFTLEKQRGQQPVTATAKHFLLRGNFHLLVGRDVSEKARIQSIIIESLGWGLAITFVLGIVGALFITKGVQRRLDVINRTCQDIIGGDLTRRIPLSGTGDEFDRLVRNVNAMLDQIERLMRGIREVSDNIAHDLRSPLNRLRGRLETSLMGNPTKEELEQTMIQSIEQTDDLLQTFNALLRIAQAEAGSKRDSQTLFDLAQSAQGLVDLYMPLAEEKALDFATDIEEGAMVLGSRHLVTQTLSNLLDNAIKYTPSGGSIGIFVKRTPSGPVCLVEDSGPGIPPEYRERVLERFYRLENSRSAPGSGLGLSLVSAVAKQHRAVLTLAESEAGGLAVSLAFPPSPDKDWHPPEPEDD